MRKKIQDNMKLLNKSTCKWHNDSLCCKYLFNENQKLNDFFFFFFEQYTRGKREKLNHLISKKYRLMDVFFSIEEISIPYQKVSRHIRNFTKKMT